MPDPFEGHHLTPERLDSIAAQMGANELGYDPWGVHLPTLEKWTPLGHWMFEKYFRVETHGLDDLPDGPLMIVPNHSGQLPLDGMLIAIAFLYEAKRPRLLRSMIEKWFPRVPFVGSFLQRCGQVVGEPENCRRLLQHGQSIQVFPEGIRGSGKTWWKRYQLQRFGTGFMRLALETNTPIVPTAVIGCEDTYPSLYDFQALAKILHMPYLPIYPQMLLGPLLVAPLPVQVELRFGEPIHFDNGPGATDAEVVANVELVKDRIDGMLQEGLASR